MQGSSTDETRRPPPPARGRKLFIGILVSACLTAGTAAGSQARSFSDPAQPAPQNRLAALSSGENRGWSLGRSKSPEASSTADRKTAAAPLYAPVLANGSNVFGSVAVSMAGIAASNQWRRVLAEDAGRFLQGGCDEPASTSDAGPCDAPGWSRWAALHERAAALAPSDRIAFVNREVNRLIRYEDDRSVYGSFDHWATFTETVRAGAGDCEDYAIAKMWLLKSLGVPLDSMQLVALRDERRQLDHAVLAVHLDDQILLLDNVHDRLLQDVAVDHYKPMFSFANQQSFVHGFRRPVERLASAQ